MKQLFAPEAYFPQLKESELTDNTIKYWLASQQTQTSKSFESEGDIVNNIKKMCSEMASLKEALSINNTLLKVTNDLLLQITGFLSIFEAQSYFWTEEWQKAEREATRDIATGNVHTFENVEQLIDFLHS